MKLVTAIIKPFKLDEVRGSPVRDRRGRGSRSPKSKASDGRKAIPSYWWCPEYVVDFLPKVKIEAAIKTDLLEGDRGNREVREYRQDRLRTERKASEFF